MKYRLIFLSIIVFAIFAACQTEENGNNKSTTDSKEIVEVTAVDYAFAAPDTIPSGWVTFRMANKGKETHYFQLNRLPEGHTFAEFNKAVFEPQDSLRQLFLAGEIDTTEFQSTIGQIAPDLVKRVFGKNIGGGVAFLAPGRSTQTTVEMTSGTYVMSCGLYSPNGRLHANQGMIRPITVTDERSGVTPPESDVIIRASGYEISIEGAMRTGKQTVAYHVDESSAEKAYHVDESSAEKEGFYWTALLARIETDAEVDKLRQSNVDLIFHNPSLVEFLGGLEYVAPGKTAYTELDLKPGRYAWVMHGLQKDTVKTFTIE